MNQRTQFDAHPEAEVLNGFAEQALGAAERELVLGHLAVCARCREVVALAAEAAAAEMPVAVAPARKAWFGWRMAWAPAMALAAVAVLAVFVYVRHRDAALQMAQIEAPVKPSAELGVPAPGLVAVAPVEQAQVTRLAEVKKAPEPVVYQSASAGMMSEVNSVEAAAPPPAPMVETADKAASYQMAEVRAFDQASAARDAAQAEAQSARATQSRMKMAAASAAPMEMAGASTAPAPAMRAMAAAPAAVRQIATLPSGQTIVSSASSGALTVAIDAGGEVFVSRDRGQHWDAVKQQWTSRAVHVEWKAAAAAFELANDQKRIWASTDGAIWTQQ